MILSVRVMRSERRNIAYTQMDDLCPEKSDYLPRSLLSYQFALRHSLAMECFFDPSNVLQGTKVRGREREL